MTDISESGNGYEDLVHSYDHTASAAGRLPAGDARLTIVVAAKPQAPS
jgi:hypothetical protein